MRFPRGSGVRALHVCHLEDPCTTWFLHIDYRSDGLAIKAA